MLGLGQLGTGTLAWSLLPLCSPSTEHLPVWRQAGFGKMGFWSFLPPFQLQEANAQLAEQACPHDMEVTPVQRRIEPRSADDSLSGVVRCLYFADTFLRDGEARAWWVGAAKRWTDTGCAFQRSKASLSAPSVPQNFQGVRN